MKTEKKKYLMRTTMLLLLMMFTTAISRAQTFSGGNGTENNPYQITTVADLTELATLANNDESDHYDATKGKYFKLMNDITYGSNDTFTPIGGVVNGYYRYFHGTFDGDGHIISGIVCNNPSSDFQGLFGEISENGIVRNVIVANATISGKYNVGGIVGFVSGGKIEHCAVLHSSISGSDYVGAIFGSNGYSTPFISDNFYGGCSVKVGDAEAATSNVGSGSGDVFGIKVASTTESTGFSKKLTVAGTDYYIEADMALSQSNYDHTGNTIDISPTVTFWGKTLDASNYTLSVTNSSSEDVTGNVKDSGIYTLTVSGANGNGYYGTYRLPIAVGDDKVVDVNVTTMATGTYELISDVIITERITINGDVVLNLGAGYTLRAMKGIELSGDNKLTINGSGTLTATGTDYKSGIGAVNVGTLIINGGTINATGAWYAAGIGGDENNTSGGSIIINGGVVTATGGTNGAGIGGGYRQSSSTTYGVAGTIVINGGQVTATAVSGDAAGIGKGANGVEGGSLTLSWTDAATDFIQATTVNGTPFGGFSSISLAKDFVLDGTETQATAANINSSGKTVKLVSSKNLSNASITGIETIYDHTGSNITVTPTVTLLGTPLTLNTDYTVSYKWNEIVVGAVRDIGNYTLTVTAKDGSGYSGSASKDFSVIGTLAGSGTEGDPYRISNSEDWTIFATKVENGTSYSGKFITLDNTNISITTMVGTSAHPFQGTFNGGGHTMILDLTGDGANYIAPFRYVNGATIKLLHTSGTINAEKEKYCAGLIGEAKGEVTITSCRSSVAISSDHSGMTGSNHYAYHGGFVGFQPNTSGYSLTFTDCLFDGSITDAEATKCAGFLGYGNQTLTITNCLMAGTLNIMQNVTNSTATFSYNGVTTLTNSYYRTDYGGNQGTAVGTMTASELKTALGEGWEVGGDDVFPIMGSHDFATATITNIANEYPCSGTDISIMPIVKNASGATIDASKYDMSLKRGDTNVSAVNEVGEYTLTMAAKDGSGYTGSKSFTFRVIDFSYAIISGVNTVYKHTGAERNSDIVPVVTMIDKTLTADDYDVTINPATVKDAGKYTLTVTGKGTYAYCGTLTKEFWVLAFEDCSSGTPTSVTLPDDNAIVVNSATTTMATGWYVVTENVTVGKRIWVNGDVHLVLCDGAMLTANLGIDVRSGKSLTIYGQEGNSGRLTAHAYGTYGAAIGDCAHNTSGTITIHGGEINATSHGDVSTAIGGPASTVTIYGGRVNASCDFNGAGIGNGTVNLSWCRSSDYIYAKRYYGTVNLLSRFVLDDNRLEVATTSNIDKKRIVPQNAGWFVTFNSQGGSQVAMQTINNNETATEPTTIREGYTFGGWYTDSDCTNGNLYNFSTAVTDNVNLYAKWTKTDFTITVPTTVTASTTTAQMGDEVTLTLVGGYDVSGSMTVTDVNGASIKLTQTNTDTYSFTMPASNVTVVRFAAVLDPGWTFVGTYKTQNFTASDSYYYGFVGTAAGGKEVGEFVRVGGYVRVKPMRAYMEAPGKPNAAPERRAGEDVPLTLRVRLLGSDGETTGIISIENEKLKIENEAGAIYDLQGRKVAQPTKGLYIVNGKKLFVK